MPTDLILSALAGLETTWAFSAFNPSVFTIGSFVDDPEGMRRIRVGYGLGAAFGLAFAAFISVLARNRLPFVVALVISVAFILVYEAAIQGLI